MREKYDTEIVRTARTDTDRRTVETQILISLNLELGSMIRDRLSYLHSFIFYHFVERDSLVFEQFLQGDFANCEVPSTFGCFRACLFNFQLHGIPAPTTDLFATSEIDKNHLFDLICEACLSSIDDKESTKGTNLNLRGGLIVYSIRHVF